MYTKNYYYRDVCSLVYINTLQTVYFNTLQTVLVRGNIIKYSNNIRHSSRQQNFLFSFGVQINFVRLVNFRDYIAMGSY